MFSPPSSPIQKLLTHSSKSVTKLTDRKIRWIIREKMKEILSTNDIALLQNVSPPSTFCVLDLSTILSSCYEYKDKNIQHQTVNEFRSMLST